MFEFFATIFFAIGFMAVLAGLVYLTSEVIDKLTAARDRRHSIEKQILALLEAIKSNTRPQP